MINRPTESYISETKGLSFLDFCLSFPLSFFRSLLPQSHCLSPWNTSYRAACKLVGSCNLVALVNWVSPTQSEVAQDNCFWVAYGTMLIPTLSASLCLSVLAKEGCWAALDKGNSETSAAIALYTESNKLVSQPAERRQHQNITCCRQIATIPDQMVRECLDFVSLNTGIWRKSGTVLLWEKLLYTFSFLSRQIYHISILDEISLRSTWREGEKIHTKIFLVQILSLKVSSTMESWHF